MGPNKKKQFSAPGSETTSIPLENPERLRGWREEAGGVEEQPGTRDSVEGSEEKKRECAEGG